MKAEKLKLGLKLAFAELFEMEEFLPGPSSSGLYRILGGVVETQASTA